MVVRPGQRPARRPRAKRRPDRRPLSLALLSNHPTNTPSLRSSVCSALRAAHLTPQAHPHSLLLCSCNLSCFVVASRKISGFARIQQCQQGWPTPMITTADSVGNNQPDGAEEQSTKHARSAPIPYPYGEIYIFAHIALAARKLATKLLSISNCVVTMYKQLEDILIDSIS
jgi:hypothetical protein